MISRRIHLCTALIAMAASNGAGAAEGFQVRYNIAGSLGGEIFAPPNTTGLLAGMAATYIDVKKVTGDDGKPLTMTVPGGTVPLPAPTPSALYPTYGEGTAHIDGTGNLKLFNFVLGYITKETYGDGRLAFGVNLPYGVKKQSFGVSATTPALQWDSSIPQGTRDAVAAAFDEGYQAGLAEQAAAESGTVSGFGDLELQAGWLYADGPLRVLAGASVVLPTGKYDDAAGPDIGFGNFYTFRPAVQVGYLATPDFAIGGKVTLGLNSKNKDNDLRSGDWLGLEAAAAYKTAIGAIGVHGVYVRQYQDDKNNDFGGSRFQTSNGGLFFTTRLPVVDAAVTIQLMKTLSSRNAKAGTFSQVRFVKVF